MMETVSAICLLLLGCCVGTLGQRDDTNTDELVPRSLAWDKVKGCSHYLYLEYNDPVTGVLMVNRSQYYITIPYTNYRFLLQCAPGTLFSILPGRCGCNTFVPLRINTNRCVRISGDFQISDYFEKRQARDDGGEDVGRAEVDGFDDMPYSIGANCYFSSILAYPCMPFFDGNSVSFGQLDISIQFSITPNPSANGVFPLIVNDGVYYNNTRPANPSFRVAYVVRNGQQLIEVLFRVRSIAEAPGSPETAVTLSCTLGDIVRGGGQPNIPWSVSDNSNTVRVFGNLGNLGGMQIVVLNSQTTSQTGIPAGGFCSGTTASRPVRARGSRGGGSGLIIAERDDALGFGLVPAGFQACIAVLSITRDCP